MPFDFFYCPFCLDLFSQLKLVLCASLEKDRLELAVKVNLEPITPLFDGTKRVFILQMDEVAVEQRARYDREHDEVNFGLLRLGFFLRPSVFVVLHRFEQPILHPSAFSRCKTPPRILGYAYRTRRRNIPSSAE